MSSTSSWRAKLLRRVFRSIHPLPLLLTSPFVEKVSYPDFLRSRGGVEKTFLNLLSFSLISAILSPEWEEIPSFSADNIKVFYHLCRGKSILSSVFFVGHLSLSENTAAAPDRVPPPYFSLPSSVFPAGILENDLRTGLLAHWAAVQGQVVIFQVAPILAFVSNGNRTPGAASAWRTRRTACS